MFKTLSFYHITVLVLCSMIPLMFSRQYGPWSDTCELLEDVTTNFTPVADFTFATNWNRATFNAAASQARGTDAKIARYLWFFNDPHSGDDAVGFGVDPMHVFINPGTYNVTLKVTDDAGVSSTVSKYVIIQSNLGSGLLQFSALWSRNADLDLIVKTPNGNLIWYGHRGPDRNTDGGLLDHDDTRTRGPENIYWPIKQTPPSGNYHACINIYRIDGVLTNGELSPSVSATLRVGKGDGTVVSKSKTFTRNTNANSRCDPSSPAYFMTVKYP